MSYNISGLTNETRKIVASLGGLGVLEYNRDPSVAPENANSEYFMSAMGVHKRQVVARLEGDPNVDLTVQAGAMQIMLGSVEVGTGVKSAGDLFKKFARGTVTGESAIKPVYRGKGLVILEPTYKYIILEDLANWGGGLVTDDGMFLASLGKVETKAIPRSNVSSAIAGGEGLFSLGFTGTGIVALESNVPAEELITVELHDDVIKIDGNFAVAWSPSLQFTVERTTKTLVGSAASGEGLVNVYRGTGKVVMCPTSPTRSLYAATHA